MAASISTTTGDTWAEVQPAGNSNQLWYSSAMSADGSVIMVGGQGGRLYISTTTGDTWAEVQPAGNSNQNWSVSSISADGFAIIAGVCGGRLYMSTTMGDTWAEIQPAGNSNKDWSTLSASSDSAIIIAGGFYDGRLYMSTTTGDTWAEIQPVGNSDQNWSISSMSADGSTILAGIYNNRLYMSTTTGDAWEEIRPAGEVDRTWRISDMSADGSIIVAGSDRFYYIQKNLYYYLSESSSTPSSDDPSWEFGATSTYTFSSSGAKTLYVWAKDNAGNISLSASANITIDTEAPVISNISVSTTLTGATITWTTDENATSTIYYGTSTSYGLTSSSDIFTTSHSITISGLSSITIYNYQIETTDQYKHTSTSTNRTFETIGTCATVQYASFYNAYPTCGPASCISGYTLSGGICIPRHSGVFIPRVIAPVVTTPVITPAPSIPTSWKTGELDNWGEEIIYTIDNFSPEMEEQRRQEAEIMKNKIKEIIARQTKEEPADRVKRLLLEKKFSGRIFLQVEENGEAWYLNPGDNKRYFLGRPIDMFNIMKKFSLGATHEYISENTIFPDRLLGKILLDVGDKGRAYYINPVDKKKYYLACPSNAFKVIKKLGLGISNVNIDLLKAGMLE